MMLLRSPPALQRDLRCAAKASSSSQRRVTSRTADVNAGAKRTAIALGAGVACAVAVTAAVLMTFRDTAPAPQTSAPTPVLVAAPPPQPASAPAAESDQAIPYTASANCPTGSTSAQALTDTTGDSAWVCVRGLQGATVDGQVLHVDFGRSYVLSAVSVTPGWVAKTPGGKDEWLQHRVVSRLQYMFNDTDRTIVTQDTANTRGPVTTALPKKVMASAVTVVILQTSRPPSLAAADRRTRCNRASGIRRFDAGPRRRTVVVGCHVDHGSARLRCAGR